MHCLYDSRPFARESQPVFNREYPPTGEKEKILMSLTHICHFAYSHRARYGLTVLLFSSEAAVQATQILSWEMTDRRRTTTPYVVACFYSVGAIIITEILIYEAYSNLVKFRSIFRLSHLRHPSFLIPLLSRNSSSSPGKIHRSR